jgi:hypothetical protein
LPAFCPDVVIAPVVIAVLAFIVISPPLMEPAVFKLSVLIEPEVAVRANVAPVPLVLDRSMFWALRFSPACKLRGVQPLVDKENKNVRIKIKVRKRKLS